MIKVAIAYPAPARVALQSLSIHIIKRLVDENPNAYSDFVFMDYDKYIGYSTKMSLKDFDIIIFSVHYELNYPHILRMMELSGINPWSTQRSISDPLIVMGGPPLMANPEPMAPFADLILIGDAEVLIPNLIENYQSYRKELEEYSNLPGFYVPMLGKHTVRKAYVKDLSYSIKLIHDTAINLKRSKVEPIFGRSAIIEIMRGCPRGCLFCMEGFVGRPVRYADMDDIKKVVIEDIDRKLIDKVTLLGLSVSDHPGFKDLMSYLIDEAKVEVSVPSLRVDSLDKDTLRLIAEGGQKVLTIAPESSERLRRALGKGFSDDDIVNIAINALELGFSHLKLYFMVGLPGETNDDIISVVSLLRRLKKIGVITYLSVNPWIPKPHTPLQWLPMEKDENIKSRINTIQESHAYDEFSTYNLLDAKVQALLSLGDRDVANLIFDASLSKLDRGSWRRLLRKYEDLLIKYVYSWKSFNEELPWSHIKIPGAEEDNLRNLLLKYVKDVGMDTNFIK
ncbi:MAG: radical SAM protein [Vulcanisaeta sp.]